MTTHLFTVNVIYCETAFCYVGEGQREPSRERGSFTQTACTKSNVKLVYFSYKSLLGKVNCIEIFSKETAGMVLSFMESEMKVVRIINNQQHWVAMFYLSMGVDNCSWCPPWPRTMTSKMKTILCHTVLFLFRTCGINEQLGLLTLVATNLKQNISSLATVIHHPAKRHIYC